MAALEKERRFFEAHREEWAKLYPGKYALVKDESLVGTFDDASAAVEAGTQRFEDESFLVRFLDDAAGEVDIPAFSLGVLKWQF